MPIKSAHDRSIASFTASARDLVTRTVHALPPRTRSLVAQALNTPGASMQLRFDPQSSITRLDLLFANGSSANLLTVEPESEIEDDNDVGPNGFGTTSLDRLRGSGKR